MELEAKQLKSVAAWLKENRKSRAWLARQAGKDRTTMAKILSGQRRCKITVLKKLSEICGIPVEVLVAECMP